MRPSTTVCLASHALRRYSCGFATTSTSTCSRNVTAICTRAVLLPEWATAAIAAQAAITEVVAVPAAMVDPDQDLRTAVPSREEGIVFPDEKLLRLNQH